MRHLLFLVLIALACQAQEPAVTTLDVNQIILDFDNTIRAHSQKLIAAKSDAERATLSAQFPSPDKLAPTMLRIMQEHPDEMASMTAMSWLVTRATQLPQGQVALQDLKEKHAAKKGLLETIDFLSHAQPSVAEPVLRIIREKNPNIEEKAAATHGLGLCLFGQSEGNPADPKSKAALAEAVGFFTEMITAYKDVVCRGFKLSDQAAAMLFEIENLNPGKACPEIEGKDSMGAVFKLSEYRGKVVVLVFWGSWCHACHATLDGVRASVQAQADKVVMLGVNTDPLETYKQLATTQNISWRNWCDEYNRGPISAVWNIRHWPTIYVIDAKGIIRGKDVSAGQLDAVLNETLASP